MVPCKGHQCHTLAGKGQARVLHCTIVDLGYGEKACLWRGVGGCGPVGLLRVAATSDRVGLNIGNRGS